MSSPRRAAASLAVAALAVAFPIAVVVSGSGESSATASAAPSATPSPASPTVAFVVALRTFEQNDVALADQAAGQSADPRLRATAARLVADGNAGAASLWALLDRWGVPGIDRLPAPATGLSSLGADGRPTPIATDPANPTAGLHHDCTVYVNDELAHLSVLRGPAFDQRFRADWVGHTTTALQDLATSRWGAPGAPAIAAPGLRAAITAIERTLRSDLAAVGS